MEMFVATMPVACFASGDVASELRKSTGQTLVATGVTIAGEAFEMFRDSKSKTFTIVLKMPEKATCIITSGTDYETIIEGDGL